MKGKDVVTVLELELTDFFLAEEVVLMFKPSIL